MFFCQYCEIFKNTYFEKHLKMTASVNSIAAIFLVSLALPCFTKCLNFWNLLLGRVGLADTGLNWKPFYPPYSPEKFSKFQSENTCFAVSKKSSEFFFLILFSAGIYLLKDWVKRSQNRNIFFLFLY